ncbi:hypothetical protein GCM10010309_72910 [Streptomyces violaceochromogenes]|nr:hypothetical protein GCM10010309_72910 [Streptomyces violaceochromogenes]
MAVTSELPLKGSELADREVVKPTRRHRTREECEAKTHPSGGRPGTLKQGQSGQTMRSRHSDADWKEQHRRRACADCGGKHGCQSPSLAPSTCRR